MGVLSVKEQKRKILEFVDSNSEKVTLLMVKRWCREKDIIEHMKKYGMSRSLVRLRLQELVKSKDLQTKMWGGTRFYAPLVIPVYFIIGVVFSAIFAMIFSPLTGYTFNFGAFLLSFLPFFMTFVWHAIERKRRNIGICISCGKTTFNGDIYCDACREMNKTVERNCQLCGKLITVKASSNERYCDACKPVVERMRGK